MLTDTTFKTLTLSLATYIMFFTYTLTRNPVLECFLTVLLMVNLSILTYVSSQNDFKEAYFRQEIYDDAPMNGNDDDEDDEDECDSECDCEKETEAAAPEAAAPETAMLTEEELAKVHFDMTVNNEPTPFSVRALVRAFDNKSPTHIADLSGGGLPPCSHSADLSGSTPTN
jgi:hypothetical protein